MRPQAISVKSSLVSALRLFSQGAAVSVVVLASLTLIGWIGNIASLQSFIPGLPAMNPITALCLLLAGISLLLLRLAPHAPLSRILTALCAMFIITIGVLLLFDSFGFWHLGVDSLFFPAYSPETQMQGRYHISIYSALSFFLTGMALLLFNTETPKGHVPAQLIGLLISIISFVILVGYAFTLLSFTPVTNQIITMPINTALAFFLLGGSLLYAHPERGLLTILTSTFLGSYIARRLLPVAIGLPIVLGWFYLAALRTDVFVSETAATLFVTTMVVVTATLVWLVATSLNRTDQRRKHAEQTQQQTNEQLQQANTALVEANTVKTDFLHIAAHDMKNPLGAIRTMAKFIQETPHDIATVVEMSSMIQNSSNQMLRLIDELLKTAMLENGKIALNNEPVDMSTVVQTVVDNNAAQAQQKQQQLILHTEPGCWILGDFTRLCEVVDNLLSNAIKYSPYSKPITIHVAPYGNTARVEVHDEGPGMTDDDLQKLFGKFQRLRARPTGGESSTGLGLSIVKQLVELHNGRVWATSKGENKGTQFTVEFPLMLPQDMAQCH